MHRISAHVSGSLAAWLKITGADAATFLQGQFTNELRHLKTGEAAYGLWLNQKGKVIADSFVIRGGGVEEFWIGSYFCAAEVIRRRLEDYVIADDVVIEDLTEAWTGVTLFGEDGGDWLSEGGRAGVIFHGRRGVEGSWEWIFPRELAGEVRAMLNGVAEIDADELARRRIEAGIPAVPMDIGAVDLPNEGGLEREAISYTKGCYLGQEVMARLKSMGQVRRRLLRVKGVGAPPKTPTPLWLGGRQVGELRSAAAKGDGFVGLAIITLMQVRAEALLALTVDGVGDVALVNVP